VSTVPGTPVSVVVPTNLRSPAVGRCLDAVLRSVTRHHPASEVLLAVNAAGERRPPRPGTDRLRILSTPPGTSAARNAAVAAARHDAVLFLDDDLVVAPDWCAALAAPLAAGRAAVAAPVRTVVRGPVTALLEYDRAFDAVPLTAGTAATFVTANAGYRRDLLPGPPFDVARHPIFGEDTDLALRIRAAGGSIAWLPDAPRPAHEVAEDIGSLLGRMLRRGSGIVRIHQRHRSPRHYLPSVPDGYRALCRATTLPTRRYAEIVAAPVRTVFATLGLVCRGAMLAGYLGEWDTALVELDQAALTAALRTVLTDLYDRLGDVPVRLWQDPPVDFATTAPADDPVPVAAVAAAFRAHAAPAPVPAATAARLTRHDLAWLCWYEQEWRRMSTLWDGLVPDLASLTAADVDRAAREVGVPLGMACSGWERWRSSPAPTGASSGWPAPVPAGGRPS
jgi:glycosyltransferase involved in cell wall biosynthesis